MADTALERVGKIFYVALKIKKAMEKVNHNVKACRDIEQCVARVSDALLKRSTETMKDEVMTSALEDLAESVQHALKLVMDCQGKDVLRFLSARDIAEKLSQAQEDILRKMQPLNLDTNIQTTVALRNIQSAGAGAGATCPSPRSAQREIIQDRDDEAPNSAPLGAMASLLWKLDKLNDTNDGGSISQLKDNIRELLEKLKKLSEVHDPPLTVNYWLKHARELSYDIEAYLDNLSAQTEDNPGDSDAKIEDCIEDSDDETEYSVDDSDAKMEDSITDSDDEMKDSVDDSDGSMQDSICGSDYKISGFRTRAEGMIERYKSFSLDSVLNSPTATTTIVSPHPSRDVVLIGMGNQITKLISLLQPKDENDNQLKILSILGDEGIGKSTLIQEIWRVSFKEKEIWHELESEVNIKRAFVRMGKKPDVRMILRSILSQVSLQEPAKDSGVTNLIRDIRKHLEQKRYFIIVDDVRSESVWDVVGRAFPHCTVGSRIITTTSDKEVVLACCNYVLQHNYIMKPLNVGDCKELFIRTVVGFRTVNLQLSNDVSDEIKRKCGGLPLAIMWTAILVANQPEIKEKLSQLETEQGLSKMEKEENLDSDVKKFLNKNLRTESTPVEILKQVLNLCYNSLPHYLKTCLLYLSLYPENYLFLKEDLVKLWIAEGFICTSKEDKIEVAGRYFDVLVSLGLIQRMDINCNKQHRQGEMHVVEDEGEDALRLRVPYVVHPTVFDFITCKSIEDNFITIIDYSQSTVALKDKIHRLSLHFGSATYATTPAGLSQVRTLSFIGLLGCMPSLLEFKIVRVMILDLWADDEDRIFSLTEIGKLLLLKYLQVSCNVTVELPGKMGCLELLETLEINSRVTAIPSDILNLSRLSYVRLEGKTYPTMHLFPPNFNVERVPQDVEHSSSHMASQITEVDLDPTLIEPAEKDQVPVISGTGDYYTTEEPINLDKMPVKDTNEHADWRMLQVSDVTQDDSPPQEKSGTRFAIKNLGGEDMEIIKLEHLQEITNNFSEELTVGSGRYGEVYRGVYNGEEIAVKKLHPLQGIDDKAFDNDFHNLRKVHHQNVVRLIAYCYESHRKFLRHNGGIVAASVMGRVLCFEYMDGGSLDRHISDKSCDLDWPTSYNIIKGICEGLKHLHTAMGKPIFHLDLKPANILLDKNMTPKIGDLGLSTLVASTQTRKTEIKKGTEGHLPPEYINYGAISNKFDVFSLGIIIIKMLVGNTGIYYRHYMPPKQFIEFVTEKLKRKLQGTWRHLSQETYILQVKTCVDIALRCVKAEWKERPHIRDIVSELDELEAQIKKMSLASDQSKDLIALQRISDSNVLAVDPALELRFRFEPRKDISCCLQLTNKTHDSIAFNIKTNETKYYTEPSRGIMPPCSKRYVSMTLRAQEEAPPNMQCHDMFIVQSVILSKELTTSSDEEITEDFFEKVMMEKVVDVVTRPIVMLQFSDVSQDNSPSQQKSGKRIELKNLVDEDMDFIKLVDLEKITNNFSEELKVGSGGYGNVYRGMYNGQEIAVKKLHPLQGFDDMAFDNDFRNLRKVHHQNVVRLIGYCHESQRKFLNHNHEIVAYKVMERVLCFEYMDGGSLDRHISDESCDLDWATSYKIIRGICEGLKHLHTAMGKPIFHMDLKPANILLDKNMTAKIGDLGLSKLVASTKTHTTEILKGTEGYMPPEYINDRKVSSKFDVFSLGVIIIKMLAGNKAYYSRREMPPEEFIKFVTEKWMEKLQGTCLSQETDILQVKTCVNIALRCVKDERKERPDIKGIVNELEKLEAQIKKMLLASDQSNNLIGLQRSSDSNFIAVDPALELRFLFEPRKDISCCLQLTNKTSDSIAFNIKTNQTKYYAESSRGIIAPCSKRYVSVTLQAQEEAPPYMQCHDILIVQSVNVSKELTPSDEEITKDFFEKVMMEKVVDVVELPIVYVARDLLRACPRVNL